MYTTGIHFIHTHIRVQRKPEKLYLFPYDMETGKNEGNVKLQGGKRLPTYFIPHLCTQLYWGPGMEDNLSVLWKY